MAQPQQQYAQSPQFPIHPNLQSAASPNVASFVQPHKRQQHLATNQAQLSPQASYNQSPYGQLSPNHSASPAGAPNGFSNVGIPAGAFATSPSGAAYNTPYTNSSPGPHTPNTSSNMPNQFPYQQMPSDYQQQNMLQGNPGYNNYGMPTPGAGTMGPPSKPPEKDREEGVDPMDVLGGTGIDLKAEEQYLFNTSYNTQDSTQSGIMTPGYHYRNPGDAASFYGAGAANQAPVTTALSQDAHDQQLADKVWAFAAEELGRSRQEELHDPFLVIGHMHAKMQRIARENGLALHIDKNGMMGHMKLPGDFENRGVKVQSLGNSRAFMTVTKGSFVPSDSMLVDQLALLSVATKQRLRTLLEDSHRLAKGRQTGSHGVVPEDWKDVADPMVNMDSSVVVDGALRNGWESAVSPHSNPLKRSFSQANKMPTPVSDGGKASDTSVKVTNEVVKALRQSAVNERDFEEARLKKRAARNKGEAGATPRAGSTMPGTPGSVAPEDKAPTKKEQKKKAEAKVNEAANHAAANVTIAQFMGGGGGLFGKKKKYSWATAGAAGGGGGGFNTPGRLNPQGGPAANAGPEKLTAEGARRIGSWREDKEKGRNIQIRDWITVLESDGHDKRSLQKAYMYLDNSDPK